MNRVESRQSIRVFSNKYEKERSIKTGEIEVLWRAEDHEIFKAHKSDGTHTLFFNFQTSRDKDSWNWLCPTKEQAQGMAWFYQVYRFLDNDNKELRGVVC